MNRNEWEFEYTASKVADGAEMQAAFRRARLDWWSQKYNEVMEEVRSSGINVEESVAAGAFDKSFSNYIGTQSKGPQVVVRHDLQSKLTECHQKIETHRTALSEYEGWIQVLRANPEQRLKLTNHDWLYFFRTS